MFIRQLCHSAHNVEGISPKRGFRCLTFDLVSYHFTVRHTSRKTNTVADVLPRINAVYMLEANDSACATPRTRTQKWLSSPLLVMMTIRLLVKQQAKEKLRKVTSVEM